jgi:hypothetical protein
VVKYYLIIYKVRHGSMWTISLLVLESRAVSSMTMCSTAALCGDIAASMTHQWPCGEGSLPTCTRAVSP